MRLVDGTAELILARIQCMRDKTLEIDLITDELNLELDVCCYPAPEPPDECVEFRPVNVSADYTAIKKDSVIADSTLSSFIITLPLDPAINDYVDLYDAQSTFFVNPVTVDRNEQLLNGGTENLVCDINSTHIRFLFNGGSQGWVSYNL